MQASFGLKNEYFDCRAAFCNLHKVEVIKPSSSLDEKLCEWGALKNKQSGVIEVNLRCQKAESAQRALEKHGIKGRPVVDAMDALNSKGECMVFIDNLLSLSERELCDVAEFAGKQRLPVMINYGRSLYEMGSIDKLYGKSPVRVLEDFGFLDRQCFILGANHLDKDELEILSQYGAKVVVTNQSDGMSGRASVNLATLLAKNIDFSFASGDFPYVNMLAEVNLGCNQTANAMADGNAASREQLFKYLLSDREFSLTFDGKDIEHLVLCNALPAPSLNKSEQDRLTLLETEILKEIK